MKQLIRLTESDLHNIVRQVINEIGYKASTLAAGANMKAADELSIGQFVYGCLNIFKAPLTFPLINISLNEKLPYFSYFFYEKFK